MYVYLQVKYPLFVSDVNGTGIFLHIFSTDNQISNFMEFLAVGSELLHVDTQMDGQTRVTKLLAAFRNFANAPKNDILLSVALWRWAIGQ